MTTDLALFRYFLSVLMTVLFPALLRFDNLEVIFIYAFQYVTSAR